MSTLSPKEEGRNEQFVLPEIGDGRRMLQTLNAGPNDKVKRVGAGFRRDSDPRTNFTGVNNTSVVNQGPITMSSGIGKLQQKEQDSYTPSLLDRR